jgi:hypothetical protein
MSELFHAIGVQPIKRGNRFVSRDIPFDRRNQFIKCFIADKPIDRIRLGNTTATFNRRNERKVLAPNLDRR